MAQIPFRRDGKGLKSGDGGGTFDDMEPRVRALEDRFIVIEMKLDRMADDIRQLASDLKDLTGVVRKLNDDLIEIKGRLSEMPNTWQMVGISATMVTLCFTGVGAGLTFVKYLLG